MDTSWWNYVIFIYKIFHTLPVVSLYNFKTRQQLTIVIWLFVIIGFIADLRNILLKG